VKGLHNWYQFYLEKSADRLTYTPPKPSDVDINKKVRETFKKLVKKSSCCNHWKNTVIFMKKDEFKGK